MDSEKTPIVEKIFDKRWDPATKTLSATLVTFEDITSAILEYNQETKSDVSTDNPANFFKDLTRRVKSANKNWPKSVLARGYTAVQVTGDSQSFEFMRLEAGQDVPFVGAVPPADPAAVPHEISSVSVPMPVRALARSDEPSLLQLAVRLRVIETHMSLRSSKKDTIRQVDHLQNSVKLRLSEIDAIFLGIEETKDGSREFLISCEAKARGEDVMMAQLVRQPIALLAKMKDHKSVVPMVVRSLSGSKLQVVEFKEVFREQLKDLEHLEVATSGIYRLQPSIPGFD